MSTYKITIRNPFTTFVIFNLRVKGELVKVRLKPFETKDLTTIDEGFVIQADSADAVDNGRKIAENFMSGYGNLEILMQDHIQKINDKVRIKNKDYTEFFILNS